MNKIQQDVEQYIRHLQSSLDKRKVEIQDVINSCGLQKDMATLYYDAGAECDYKYYMSLVNDHKQWLKHLHKEQATETRMLKFFENARSFAIALEKCK